MLPWDSQFFGFPVARATSLEKLGDLKQQGVRLVYWSTTDAEQQAAAVAAGGTLVDKKATYRMEFKDLPAAVLQMNGVEEYTDTAASDDLIQLSIQAGLYSRFRVDPKMDPKKFEELYTTWMQKSCSHELAKAVLVIREQGQCVAVVTVGEKNGIGDIGLVAVDASQRGKGYGQTLIRAAQTWFVQHGYTAGQVVTQGDNIAASKLYEKCGYHLASLEYFFHFWL